MSNLHGAPDTLKEWQAIGGDLLPACLISSSGMTPPGSGLTVAAAACTAYARSASDLVYIDQPAVSVTVPNVAGSHWLIVHRDTHSTVADWTRRAGSHFLTRQAATQPTIPDGAVLAAQLTVTGGNITAVDTTPALSPPLSRQTADAVAITDGRISLGGHAPTGVLDVQGSVVSSDLANQYIGVRVWPVAPSGALYLQPLRVEAATGAALSTAIFYGLSIQDQPASLVGAQALELVMSAGTGRYNVRAAGTAQNYFAGNVGIANSTPSYPLDVTGNVRLNGLVGVSALPDASCVLNLAYNKTSLFGMYVRQTTSDTGGGNPIVFQNVAATTIGSIGTNATSTSYNTSSDVRLKHAVQALTGALDAVKALRPVKFRWNQDDSEDEGFLAHQLQTIIPHAVTGEPDQVNEDGSVRPQQVDSSKIVVWLVSALQEVTARLEALESALGV